MIEIIVIFILIANALFLGYYLGKGKIVIERKMSDEQFKYIRELEEERTKEFRNKANMIMNFQDAEFIEKDV